MIRIWKDLERFLQVYCTVEVVFVEIKIGSYGLKALT